MTIRRIAIFLGAAFLCAMAAVTPAQSKPQTSSAKQSNEPSASAAMSPDAAAAKAKSILLSAAKAAGGSSLHNIKSIEISTKGQASSPNGPIDISLKLTIVYPNQLHTTADLPGMKIQQVFDGGHGWLVSPQGPVDLPTDYNAEFFRGIALTGGFGLYRDALDGKNIDIQYIDEEDFDGKPASAVKWTGPSGPVKLYFDPATHLLIGAHFRSITPQGPIEVDQHWSDFHAVDGLQYPYHNLIYHDGDKFSETTVQEVKTNIPSDPALFAKPALPSPPPAPTQ